MPRRVELPGAAELFRPTKGVGKAAAEAATEGGERDGEGLSTGRVRHDEKITVYVSADELISLEQARLTLRARHGIAVDRGRIVRLAIGLALADLDNQGSQSGLVQGLGSA